MYSNVISGITDCKLVIIRGIKYNPSQSSRELTLRQAGGLDEQHSGMIPNLSNEFLPISLGRINIEADKYFDRSLENSKRKITDKKTIPLLVPEEL